MAVSIRPVWLCKPYPPPDGTGHKILAGGIEPPISRISAGCTHRCTTPGEKYSGRNSNPQRLLRRQVIYPVNRPEYEQGLPGSNRRLRFWRPLCFRLHQAPLNIPDRIRTCTAGTGIRYGHPFHHGDKALPKRFELLYYSLEGCCSYPLSYGNMMRPQAAFSVFSTIIISFMVTPNRMLKARRLSTEGSASPRNHLYTFDLSQIPR